MRRFPVAEPSPIGPENTAVAPGGHTPVFSCLLTVRLRLSSVLNLAVLLAGFPVPGLALDTHPAVTESHRRMVEVLDGIARRMPDENLYLGDLTARRMRAFLDRAPSSTPPSHVYKALYDLGREEMNLGNEEVAIRNLLAARDLFPSTGLPPKQLNPCLYFLGVAHLRLGETENCCRMANPESCLFPIRGKGTHAEARGSETAARWLEQFLATRDIPQSLEWNAIWMLNIAHMTLGTYPGSVPESWRLPLAPPGRPQPEPFPEFPNVAAALGLDAFSLSGGAIADDFNGDGAIDLVVSVWDPRENLRYYQNDGTGTFVDRTAESGLTGIRGGLNLKQADFDNDGDLDILVLRGAWLEGIGQQPNSLLRNEGLNDGVPFFRDVTFLAGLAEVNHPVLSGDWADYDVDGDLDLYLGNETTDRHVAPGQLFRNDGPGPEGVTRFTDVAAEAGVTNLLTAKGVAWGDYDGDRYPDLYVSNFFGPNRLYRNLGDGRFEDVAPRLGVDGPEQSFPAWFWDYNNDGHLDLMVPNYLNFGCGEYAVPWLRGTPLPEGDLPAVYTGDGRGGFTNRVRETRLDVPMMPMGCNFGDLDNDGFPDFYLGTGTPNYSDIVPNQLFRNRGGRHFDDVTLPSRMGHLQKGHGIALADFDGDGYLDVFSQLGGALPGDRARAALFRNPGFPGNRWIKIRLHGVRTNRFGVGCRIGIVVETSAGDEATFHSLVGSGASFGANPVSITHIGLGPAGRIKRIDVSWPVTGEVQTIADLPLDRLVTITEGVPGWR